MNRAIDAQWGPRGNTNCWKARDESLPLFEGGARRAEQLGARRDLILARRQRDATAQRIAQRARSAAQATPAATSSGSFPNRVTPGIP